MNNDFVGILMKLKYSMDVIERNECLSQICIFKKHEIIKF
jgi:hypothetical protein